MTVAHVTSSVTRPVRAPYRLGTEMAGFLLMLLGAWGAIVPYVGPVFGFSGDGTASWTWNLAHSLLFLVPGVVAFFLGLAIMLEGRMAYPGRGTSLAVLGFMAVVCGAWFVVGPFAWPALEGTSFFVAGSPLRELAYWVGYSVGPGGLMMALGAYVMGEARTVVQVVGTRGTASTSTVPPAPTAGPTPTGTA